MVYLHHWLWFYLQHWSRQHLTSLPEWNPDHRLGRSEPWHSAAPSLTLPKGHWRNCHTHTIQSVFDWRKGNPTQPCRWCTNLGGLYCYWETCPSVPTRKGGQSRPQSSVAYTHTQKAHRYRQIPGSTGSHENTVTPAPADTYVRHTLPQTPRYTDPALTCSYPVMTAEC